MVDLFIDIETVPDMTPEEYFDARRRIDSGELTKQSDDRDLYWRCQRGGLNPFEGRVMLITYQVNDAHTFRLKEWEVGERGILQDLYRVLADLQRDGGTGQDRLKIIGHNILGFDLFFLYDRMRHHQIDDEKWLYQRIINRPEIIDFLQLHLPLNDYQTKGIKHDVLAHAYGFPTKDTLGSGETPHYFQKEYDKIIEYSVREFVYPEMFAKIRSGGMISRDQLRESIRHYNESVEAGG